MGSARSLVGLGVDSAPYLALSLVEHSKGKKSGRDIASDVMDSNSDALTLTN